MSGTLASTPAADPPAEGRGVGRTRLGFLPTLGIALGTTVGAGVFAFTGVAASEAGPWLAQAFLLASLPIALALLPMASLAAALPTAGGNYRYPSRLLSPSVAFLGVWIYAFGAFFGFFPLYALTCVDYLQGWFPGLPALPVAAAILTLFWLINLVGLRVAAFAEAALVGVLLLALGLFVFAGLPHVQASNLRLAPPSGLAGLAAGASLLSFAYLGSNALIEMGHEIRRPERTIPLAMGACLLLVLPLYAGVGLVAVGAAPWTSVANEDLADVAARFLSRPLLAFFILGGALTALGTTLNATFTWGTKSLQVLCEDGFLPASWGRDHPRFGTPARILTGLWLLSLVGLVLPVERSTLNAWATLGGLTVLLPVLAAAAVLPRRCPEAWAASRLRLPGWLVWTGPIVGGLVCLGAMATVLLELLEGGEALAFGAWILCGLGWLVRVRGRVRPQEDRSWR